MKRLAMVLAILVIGMFSPRQIFAYQEMQKDGAITLSRYKFGDDESKKNLIVLGDKVVFKVNAYIEDFFKDTIINANAKIINMTDDPMQAIYFITFYDEQNNVVGAHATNWTLKPQGDINYGSALIKGKEEDFRRVKKYKLQICYYKTVPEKK